MQNSLCHSIDLASQTGLLAGSCVPMVHMIRGSLVNRLAGKRKEGLRFVSVSGFYSIENTAGSSAHTGLLGSVLCMALSVSLHTKDRRFDIWQIIHPLNSLIPSYSITGVAKKQTISSGSVAFVKTPASESL